MPDLSTLPVVTLAITLGRYAVVAYATFATIFTTACLTLHALTTLDRRAGARRMAARTVSTGSERRPARPLFVPLEPTPDGD